MAVRHAVRVKAVGILSATGHSLLLCPLTLIPYSLDGENCDLCRVWQHRARADAGAATAVGVAAAAPAARGAAGVGCATLATRAPRTGTRTATAHTPTHMSMQRRHVPLPEHAYR